jgi:uncharacterized protein YdeI (YjbR/CyaY-like superfamily)
VPREPSMPSLRDAHFAEDRAAWRAWLAANHARAEEVWLLFYKKRSGKRCVSLGEAVEEALCFGWIDGKLHRIDDERHILRFCPRRPRSVWSESNKARVRRLTREGRMTPAGLEAVKRAKKNGQWQAARKLAEIRSPPADLGDALAANARAARFFASLPPSHRKTYIAWVLAAKRPETRARRIREVVARSARGIKPGVPA